MGTKVQSKTCFPGSMRDLNNGFCNATWDPYHDNGISGSGNGQFYDTFLMRQAVEGYTGYAKEQMRQTILKQESIFRHQLQELHRLYKIQRDLMNELSRKQHSHHPTPAETSNSTHFQSQTPCKVPNETHFLSNIPTDVRPLNSKCRISQRNVIDLEQSADQVKDVHNLSMKRTYNLADLNEPIQAEEPSFWASFKNMNGCLTEKLQRRDSSANTSSGFWSSSKFSRQNVFKRDGRICSPNGHGTMKCYDNAYSNGVLSLQSNPLQPEPTKAFDFAQPQRTIFGVELKNHAPSFNPSSQTPELFAGNSRFTTSSRAGVGILSNVTDGLTNHENRLPAWLMLEPSKRNETRLYQMNLDSLQNRSQQFFKKSELDKCQNVTKILGVPIVDLPQKSENLVRKDPARDRKVENLHETKDLVEKNCESHCISDFRCQIDLNLSCNEEEAPLSAPEAEIDLEAPVVLESETDSPEIKNVDSEGVDTLSDLDKVAAEAIMSISSRQPPEELTLLRWFAEVITCRGDVSKYSINDKACIPEGMDYFEFMTLKLKDTKEKYYEYDPMILAVEKEEEAATLPKRATRKGGGKRGRQRRDFQRDVLPGIVSLSRREVSEDLQTFEEVFSAVGVSWQLRLSKRKGGRGRRQSVVVSDSSPQTPPPVVAAAVFREVALEEKSLGGWGKRTRRVPRPRCQNGGGNRHSFALKC